MNVVFYISAAVAVASTVMVITRLNAVHALLYLIVSLLAVAVVFFVLGAPFVAALEVIIYAGAIMVMFVFVIMMLNLGPHATREEKAMLSPGIWIGPGILGLILAAELVYVLAAGVGGNLWMLTVILVINSAIGLYYYLRIIVAIFRPPAEAQKAPAPAPSAAGPSCSLPAGVTPAGLTLALVWLGVYPDPMIRAIRAAVAALFTL